MDASKQQTDFYEEGKQFLSLYMPKDEFIKGCNKFYNRNSEEFYILVLTEVQQAISGGNVEYLENLGIFIDHVSESQDKNTLTNYYNNDNNPIKNTNLVILACKHNKVNILEYLLENNSNILCNLSVGIRRAAISPNDIDETCHNAFYYAIRSGNVELLDTLINKWPNNYFAKHFDELDEVLSKAYEELKLKNVLLTEEIEVFVENKLINLRFYTISGKDKNVKSYLNNIKGRIELVIQNIRLLKANYSNMEKVDEEFVFIAKFIAQNIHILKQQLRSTYVRLPWEEIEFCLISFVSSHIKQQEINLFYNAILNKSKILNYLEHFANKLEEENNNLKSEYIHKIAILPKSKRERVVAEIICNYPQFEELYSDYQQIRDIHSLWKISDYIKLALSADPKQREGQLIIARVLQVVGEYLKNTLESPKLSTSITDLLLLSLPRNTRNVIIDLRNSLSHAYSLNKRTEIEENANAKFFVGVQNDTKKIDCVIADILHNNKVKVIRMLLKKIISSESSDEIKEVAEIFSNVKLDEMITVSFRMMEHDKLEKLIKELGNKIIEKGFYEKDLFNEIDKKIHFENTKSKHMRTDYVVAFNSLKSLIAYLNDLMFDYDAINNIKFFANKVLHNIPLQTISYDFKEIVQLIMSISHSARSRVQNNDLDELNRLIFEILYIIEFRTGDIKWIEELRNKLSEKVPIIPIHKQKNAYNITKEKYLTRLELKFSELKSMLSNNSLRDGLLKEIPSYKGNKKLQAVVEMLVLDILSILSRSEKHLENNLLVLDYNSPLLTGKCLRNYLAHDNSLVNILLSDPSITVILNAEILISENLRTSKKKFRTSVKDNASKLKDKYDQNLVIINNQKKMFAALTEGRLDDLEIYLRKGADVNARTSNLSTALHFAAQAPTLEVIKFVIDQKLEVNVKDVNGQNPLHIAAAHGRRHIVEYFVKKMGLHFDNPDNNGKTPLHIAAKKGCKDAVEILLQNNANTSTKDIIGFSPLHYAINNNHIDVAKIMLKREMNVDINETDGGLSSLHIAAENGNLELVNYLLNKKANVNAKNDMEGTPLHIAASNGHMEVVNALILKGADVNIKAINGCTALHYAIDNGYGKIVDILLKHGADVNVVDKTYNNTPLHYAAKTGYEQIVKILLENEANANIRTIGGKTPLHFAAQGGHIKIVVALLEHGVNIHAEDKNCSTPLYYAAGGGYKPVAEILIKNGAKINGKNYNNLTPLHIAALNGHKDVLQLLISNNAQVEAQDNVGNTPLHVASMNGSKDIIDLLIKNKAIVNATNSTGMTPLHIAARCGHKDAVISLIKSNAKINIRAEHNLTPLFGAILGGHKNIANLLIQNGAKVKARGIEDSKPLHIAVEGGFKEIVKILLANGANVNVKCRNLTPLISAIRCNDKEMVELLLENGACVDAESNGPLSLAVIAGYRDIVETLLKNVVHINVNYSKGVTLLHLAASRGHKEIVNVLIATGANVDATTNDGSTPLYLAAQKGHEEVVEILIANRANVNSINTGDTALHMAAGKGHIDVVKILLSNGAKVDVKDYDRRTPLELAVSYGHLNVVKMLLQYKRVDMNTKGNDDWTILHIASQGNSLEMVKYLVDEGSDINAKNASGSKPIHIAAREGFKNAVEYFLSKGLSVNEPGSTNQTLLHYTAMKGHLEVVKYLIVQGADVNAQDTIGLSPVHIAAVFGYRNIIEYLLQSGAIYNAIDKLCRRPLDMTSNKDVMTLLVSTDKLFESVKCNNALEVENCIQAGASVNARNNLGGTSLHYAAWKGYEEICKILLQNKANPNIAGSKGYTPLHYAAKSSYLNIVKVLLYHGAVYNADSDSGKMPSDVTADKNIISLFKLISESFKNVKDGNIQIFNDLNKVKDIDTIKAVMSASNRQNKTLIVAAVHSNFSKVEQLKQIWQKDVSTQINTALIFLDQGNYQKALNILRKILERRKEVLGPNNPGTLDIQMLIGTALYKQGIYQEALNILEEVFQKQKEMLGFNNKDTLNTRSTIALVLHRQEKNEEAFTIFQEVYKGQNELLGPNHLDTINTQFHMALVLDRLGHYEEALNINKIVFEKGKETLGVNNRFTVSAQNNIALVLTNQGKYEESLKIYEEVLEKKKKLLGINHDDTLRTLSNIAVVLFKQKKYREALIAFQKVLNIKKKSLQDDHPETLETQCHIANIFFVQGKFFSSLKVYNENFDKIRAVFGPSHPIVLDVSKKIEMVNFILKCHGNIKSNVPQQPQKDTNIAASKDD